MLSQRSQTNTLLWCSHFRLTVYSTRLCSRPVARRVRRYMQLLH